MATQFFAYVPRKRLPTVEELNRAMSSRGWRVEIKSDSPLDQLSGAVPLEVDDAKVDLTVSVETPDASEVAAQRDQLEAAGDEESLKRSTVLKTTDIRFTFSGDEKWARDVARGLALLACGAFENPADGRLLHFGY